MREELLESRLEVALVPSRDPQTAARGGRIRVAVQQNPEWYRELCAGHPSNRRGKRALFQTRIKRQLTLKALALIAQGKPAGVYAERLRVVICAEADRQAERFAYEARAYRAQARDYRRERRQA
jgi:hypothetical protein